MTESVHQLIADATATTSVESPRIDQPTRLSPGVLTPDILANRAGMLRSDVGILSEDATRVHGDSLRLQLEHRANEAAKRAPVDLLTELADLGFSWTGIARSVGVSIPTVRKWRQGETASGGNRRKLARLVALVGVLEGDHLICDVASWLDVPLAGSSLTGIDVLECGCFHELMQYAAGHIESAGLLDRALPAWRDGLDDRFEVYTAGDGERAIRLRDENHPG